MSNQNQHKLGYKHTPLGWIPEEWAVKEVSDIATLSSGTTPSRQSHTKFFLNGSIRWVKTTDLNNSDIIKTEEMVTEVALEETSLKLFPAGTILVAMYGGFNQIGRTGLLKIPATVNQALTAVQLKNGDDPKYVLEWFNYRVGYWKNFAGSSRKDPNITGKDVGDFPVLIPTEHEQRKISTILSTWDEAITKTQQLIAQLQLRNKSLMQQLLKPKDDWSDKKMSDIFDRVVRKNTNGNTNVITISAQRGFVKRNDFFKKLVASDTLDNYFLVRKGEFCYNKSYSNGYDWGATKRLKNFDEAVVTTLYICFRIKDENEYSGDYFEYFFDANILDNGLAKIAHEGGRAHGLLNVTPGDFFNLKIYLPPYDEQLRIFKILSTAKNELILTEQKLAALQRQKKGLMQKLLTGEVRTI